ncbi:STAS domain-containing protein [Streptomyces sp. NPDC055709]
MWTTTPPRRCARCRLPRPASGRQLVIDLARLTFFDSRCISVLIAARNHALADASVVLAAVPARVTAVL